MQYCKINLAKIWKKTFQQQLKRLSLCRGALPFILQKAFSCILPGFARNACHSKVTAFFSTFKTYGSSSANQPAN
jgi:hypothetical protein